MPAPFHGVRTVTAGLGPGRIVANPAITTVKDTVLIANTPAGTDGCDQHPGDGRADQACHSSARRNGLS